MQVKVMCDDKPFIGRMCWNFGYMWFFKASGSRWVSFSYELTFLNFYTKIRASVSSCLIKKHFIPPQASVLGFIAESFWKFSV